MRLLEQGHHQSSGRNLKGSASGSVHFIETALVEGEKVVTFEETAGFEQRLIEPAVALIKPPGGCLAKAGDEPRRNEKRRVGRLNGATAKRALVDEGGGNGGFEALLFDAAAKMDVEPQIVAGFADEQFHRHGPQRHGVPGFPVEHDGDRDFPIDPIVLLVS